VLLAAVALWFQVAPFDHRAEVTVATSRSLRDFGECFRSMQEAQNGVWAFVPNDGGGTFSGSDGSVDYQLQFREGAPTSQLVLLLSRGKDEQRTLRSAVDRCR